MYANYHTHTFRCYHATGMERFYVKAAIAGGLSELGFSDHAPMPFSGGYASTFRMKPSLLADYVETLTALREEYRGRIKIHIGLEAEYYPALFADLLKMIRPYRLDYLILGQHFIGNEKGEPYMGAPGVGEKEFTAYVDQVIAGMDTGVFTYVAHPDLPGLVGDVAFYEREAGRLCGAARAHGMPLEYNLLGMATGRAYPQDRFFAIAREVGCEVIIGTDAHSPDRVANAAEIARAEKNLAALGITPIDRLPSFRPIR